ncbi:hypothetical protein T484DRAFT_1769770 [Baffinella frigidus]|nr:hypothetical protein T484DRAFT_1769770 [Cryptophyta sp. CCMP2293]
MHHLNTRRVGNRVVPMEPHICSGFHPCDQRLVNARVTGHADAEANCPRCRQPCVFASQGCPNTCSSKEHIHDATLHICSSQHPCAATCDREEPCLWEGPRRRRRRKECGYIIPPGFTTHEGAHD